MKDWLADNGVVVLWVGGLSVLCLVATMMIGPAMFARIPADYFTHRKRPHRAWADHGHPMRLALLIGKNVLGYLLVLAGIAMLLLPGQGLVTLLAGFLLVDFPGKYRVEKWLVSRPRVLRALNWFRKRRGKEPLVPPGKGSRGRGRRRGRGKAAAAQSAA